MSHSSSALAGPALMRDVLRRIATGPRMSKDISREEARDCMSLVLEQAVDPVQSAIFLVALRMKRETDEENAGVLDALQAASCQTKVEIPDLVDVTDPFNGVDRHLPLSPFVPAILAACGLPAVLHGCLGVGPKHGVTFRDVLLGAGCTLVSSPEAAASQLEDPALGWTYLDQRESCPGLDALRPLRELIVKRPCLSTLEKLLRPLRASGANHLLTGYVHKEYPEPMLLMAREAGYKTALIVRGTEGGVMPPLARGLNAARLFHDGATSVEPVEPADFGVVNTARFLLSEKIEDEERSVFRERNAGAAAQAGLAALAGEAGDAADFLIFTASATLAHVRQLSPAEANAQVRGVLANGSALKRFRSLI